MRAALEDPSVTNRTAARVLETLDNLLARETVNAAPWRKVVNHERVIGLSSYEMLECGHRYSLRRSSRAGSGWEEETAKKRRCKACLPKEGLR